MPHSSTRTAPRTGGWLALCKCRRVRAAALGVLVLAAAMGAEARLYRWTDEDGVVHFSDRLPPEAIRKERKVYNEAGEPVEVVPAPKTPEQIEAEKREAERLAAEARRRREEAERLAREARTLREMYGSVADIEVIRDERLELIDTAIGILQNRERKLMRRLDEVRRRIADQENAGRKPSKALLQQLEVSTRALEDTRQELKQRRRERLDTERRFARDIERYIELVEEKSSSTAQR